MSYLSWASCGNFNRSGLTAEENLLNTESTLPRLEVRRSVLWSIKYRDKFNKASLFLRFRIKNVLNTYLVQWIEKRLLLKFWRTGSIIFCGDMAACATFNWTVTINLRVVTAEVNVNYTSQFLTFDLSMRTFVLVLITKKRQNQGTVHSHEPSRIPLIELARILRKTRTMRQPEKHHYTKASAFQHENICTCM